MAAGSRIGAGLGLLSVGMLAASFVWAHHWNAPAITIVATWAVATIGAAIVSSRSLAGTDAPQRLAKLVKQAVS